MKTLDYVIENEYKCALHSMEDYTTAGDCTVIEVLKKIDKNKKGFLLVINEYFKVIGTLTDGDIRRALIAGKTLEDSIENIYNRDFNYVSIYMSFKDLVEAFKLRQIDFLPILDNEGKLINLITKKQLQILLLEDIRFDMRYNFFSLDETIIEHEIYSKPWGFFKTTFLSQFARAKVIKVDPLGELSLQEHKKREEHWVIIKGEADIVIGESKKHLMAGDYIFIPKTCRHKMINTSKCESLIISEIQMGEYFGEDDIIRYEDIYGRLKCD